MTSRNNCIHFMPTGHTAIADFYNNAIADMLHGATRIIDGAWRAFARAQHRTRMIRHAENLPEYLLRDIGIEREELLQQLKYEHKLGGYGIGANRV